MRLVNNGEYGLLVNVEYLKSLNTIELIQQEIDNCQNGMYEIVERNDNQVVYVDDYIIHLYEQLVKLMNKRDKESTILIEKLTSHIRFLTVEQELKEDNDADDNDDNELEIIDRTKEETNEQET